MRRDAVQKWLAWCFLGALSRFMIYLSFRSIIPKKIPSRGKEIPLVIIRWQQKLRWNDKETRLDIGEMYHQRSEKSKIVELRLKEFDEEERRWFGPKLKCTIESEEWTCLLAKQVAIPWHHNWMQHLSPFQFRCPGLSDCPRQRQTSEGEQRVCRFWRFNLKQIRNKSETLDCQWKRAIRRRGKWTAMQRGENEKLQSWMLHDRMKLFQVAK